MKVERSKAEIFLRNFLAFFTLFIGIDLFLWTGGPWLQDIVITLFFALSISLFRMNKFQYSEFTYPSEEKADLLLETILYQEISPGLYKGSLWNDYIAGKIKKTHRNHETILFGPAYLIERGHYMVKKNQRKIEGGRK